MTDDERTAWLKTLKAGDEVAVFAEGRDDLLIRTIHQISPAGRFVSGGMIFNADGLEVGYDPESGKGRRRMERLTGDVREAERAELLSLVKAARWDDEPLYVLRAVAKELRQG